MNLIRTKNIVYRTLLLYAEITSKYNLYNEGIYLVAEHKYNKSYIKFYSTINYIDKNAIYNSEPYNYYAIIYKDILYIINRENLINAYELGDIPYTFDNYITIEENLLNAMAAKTIKIHYEDINI